MGSSVEGLLRNGPGVVLTPSTPTKDGSGEAVGLAVPGGAAALGRGVDDAGLKPPATGLRRLGCGPVSREGEVERTGGRSTLIRLFA